MKRILILITVLSGTYIHAQVSEGIIKYTMELAGGNGGISTGGNVSAVVYFKKDKSLTEMVTPVYSMKTLSDSKGLLILIDARGKKTYSMKSRAVIDRERIAKKSFSPVIELTKEKKNILGYECTKAFISMPASKGVKNRMAVWHTAKILNTTADLGGVTPEMVKKLKGTVLEIDIEQGPVTSRIKAVSISVKPVPDAIFKLSTAGYRERRTIPIN